MYIWKNKKICIREQQKAGEIIGVTPQYLSAICGRKRSIRKLLAYCITKYIDNNAEIEDYFERIG